MSASLSPSTRRALAFKWIDRTTRVHCAAAFERLGNEDAATRLRELPELCTRALCRDAEHVLDEIGRMGVRENRPDDDEAWLGAVACVFGMIFVIQHLHEDGPDLHEVVVATLSSARCVDAYAEEQCQLNDVADAQLADRER